MGSRLCEITERPSLGFFFFPLSCYVLVMNSVASCSQEFQRRVLCLSFVLCLRQAAENHSVAPQDAKASDGHSLRSWQPRQPRLLCWKFLSCELHCVFRSSIEDGGGKKLHSRNLEAAEKWNSLIIKSLFFFFNKERASEEKL